MFHGFLLHNGTFTTIDAPGASGLGSALNGIGPQGDLLGGYQDSGGTFHGFLLGKSGFMTIDVPGALGTSPLGISPSGVIAGSYIDAGGNDHGFVMNVQ